MSIYISQLLQSIPIWLLTLLGFTLASVITYISVPWIVSVANMKGLCDTPNHRASHTKATPTLGGIAIFTSLILSTVIVAGTYFNSELLYIIVGLLVLFMIGMKDDILVLDPRKKLVAQLAVAVLITVLADIRLTHLHGLLGIGEIPYLVSIGLSIFMFVAIINAFNLIDGIDGLASGIGVVTSSAFGIWFMISGSAGYAVMSFALAGSLATFFMYNVFSRKNKIFLGDTGSLIVGLILSVISIKFLQLDLAVAGNFTIQSAPAVVFGILIIPLYDTLRIFTIRILRGGSPFKADNRHLHHRLLRLGITHLQATVILLSVNLLFIGISYFLQGIGNLLLVGVLLATASLLSRWLLVTNRNRAIRLKEENNRKAEEIRQAILHAKESVPSRPKTKTTTLRKEHSTVVLN